MTEPAPITSNETTTAIRAKATDIGFDCVGISSADSDPLQEQALRSFLKQGRHGDMAWMADTVSRRVSPKALWSDVRSVVVLGLNYGPAQDPRTFYCEKNRGVISVYAQGRDYHDVFRKRLKKLARWIARSFGGEVKVFVDTAPVMEKPLAARAGVGWQGKHTNLVSREFGSWLFLGEVFTTLDLETDTPEVDHCGSCNLCQQACPTGALDTAYQIDATKCISYLTIEKKDSIEPALMAQMSNHLYGCDDCLSVCPWNKFDSPAKEQAFLPRAGFQAPALADVLDLDDAAFRVVFAGSPIKRSGRNRMVRNALIAAGNSGLPTLEPAVKRLTVDDSEVVSKTARWAMERLKDMDKSDE